MTLIKAVNSSRCQLCSLNGEELREDEDLRKKLKSKEDLYHNFHDSGEIEQTLEILKQKVDLMEANWDKFSNQV